ncbi:MAG: CoA-disulfide reductase [Desulfobacteraceae bacterium]|nr:MAG: CoA-disulfide reductase [Desulfobacteraceae bacterium]
MAKRKRLLIVGGVAGGASCAARARRLSEDAEIIIFERGPYVSFANCGLPYYIGNVITSEDDLIVASPELFLEWFEVDVRSLSNVISVNRENKEIEVKDLKTGRVYQEKYDALLLSPGSAPLRPKLEGIDLPGIFTLRNIPDTREIVKWIKEKEVKRAAIVGGGFIGLEMTENLRRLGIHVTIIEMLPHVMPALDPEIAGFIHKHLEANGVSLMLGSAVSGFAEANGDSISVRLQSGNAVPADIVILSIGVRPEIQLARDAGLSIGALGGISVDDFMRTSDESIWAVGDAVEVKDFLTKSQSLIPLAGPANRQGRVAAESIFGTSGNPKSFRGIQATAVCGIMGMTIASTGLTEKAIKRNEKNGIAMPYEKIYLHPDHHATYYPDAKTITMKLIFSTDDGRVLGAQAVGFEGVEKRIDVISAIIQKNGTVYDLEEAELCYAPQYGSAKDPVNMAGMIAANVLKGYSNIKHWEELPGSDPYIIDVRDPYEFVRGHHKSAVNIPLNSIRFRLDEIPRNRDIWLYCLVGKRSYFASRILRQKGFNAWSVSGGYVMYKAVKNIFGLS